jgi:FlaA1/EpsC-like NDP-sugar epimerase
MITLYNYLSHKIDTISYLPRWIIIIIDMSFLLLSSLITYMVFNGIQLIFFSFKNLAFLVIFYIIINLLFFRILKTYSGIVRHSTLLDAIRLFLSQITTGIIFIFFSLFLEIHFKSRMILIFGIFVNSLLGFTLLIIYRIIVKNIFEKHQSKKSNLQNAVIYGTDTNSIAVSNALQYENPKRFNIIGFLDSNTNNSNKKINNINIYSIKKTIPITLRTLNINAIIITDKNISNEETIQIAEQCIEYNFKVYIIPTISNWEDQKEITKKIKSFDINDLLDRKPIVLKNNLIEKYHKKNVIFISGAAGSIGSEIARQVINNIPSKLILVDQSESSLHALSLELNYPIETEVYPIVGDIKDKLFISEIFKKYQPNIVYHAAAYKHVPLMEDNVYQAITTNVIGTKNLADLAIEYHVNKFVMISTDKAVNPSNIMGASKRIAEIYVQSLNNINQKTQFITTRFGNVLGSNGSVVPLFTKQINEGGPITLTHPDIIRYFMTIPEACQLVLEAGIMGKGGEIYIFDMGKPVKIIDLAVKMIKIAGYIPYKDIDIKIVGLRPGEKLYEELLNNETKTKPTHHKKIMIADSNIIDFKDYNTNLEHLIKNIYLLNDIESVILMKKIVPEFKSLNSKYENLDN